MGRPKNSPAISDNSARLRVLAAATELFTRRGYAAATVREIVGAAGVTKPILYYYFGNKAGVYLEILKAGFRDFEKLLEDCQHHQGSAKERILHLADETHRLWCSHLGAARLMQSIYYGPPQGAPFFDFDVYHEKFYESVKQLVKVGIKGGEFRAGDPEYMTWAVIAVISLANEMKLAHPENGLGHQGLNAVLKLIFTGISFTKAQAKGKKP
ncbi:MAG TPA: TetR/AcrR family transcriptional regulator [Terriglobia bacterium]|nr:TetR/AcrR family transcriptional regulator [Terriglobia bacterium]